MTIVKTSAAFVGMFVLVGIATIILGVAMTVPVVLTFDLNDETIVGWIGLVAIMVFAAPLLEEWSKMFWWLKSRQLGWFYIGFFSGVECVMYLGGYSPETHVMTFQVFVLLRLMAVAMHFTTPFFYGKKNGYWKAVIFHGSYNGIGLAATSALFLL